MNRARLTSCVTGCEWQCKHQSGYDNYDSDLGIFLTHLMAEYNNNNIGKVIKQSLLIAGIKNNKLVMIGS